MNASVIALPHVSAHHIAAAHPTGSQQSPDAILRAMVRQLGSEITEERIYTPKTARYADLPETLHPEVRANLLARFPSGLYAHQSLAISTALRGDNICICTPTASGKTVVFSSVVVSKLKTKPGSKALALYPAKALIHDQQLKWEAVCQESGLTVHLIHGGIPSGERINRLNTADIVLMTPDVLHAWVLPNLDHPDFQAFLSSLDTVVLDEAHVYDGVFGTNMAYLLRRLQAVSSVRHFLLSTATIGEPEVFVTRLVGASCTVIDSAQDGTATPEKKILACRLSRKHMQRDLNVLIQALITHGGGRFLIFVDSRKRVEELTASVQTALSRSNTAVNEDGEQDKVLLNIADNQVLPYRAGYEEDDRARIQEALTQGRLAGVITTSALELGIDIGEIETVINLGIPATIKAFWQRAGRAGRQRRGVVLVVDESGRLEAFGGLDCYLDRMPEPAWLYLDNEYLQYANVLCAAEESALCQPEQYNRAVLDTLPAHFVEMLDNEITPTHSIATDLYPLKQQAVGGAHLAFPLRSGIEKSYKVVCRSMPGRPLGNLNYAQVLQEAFPGAIYRYLAHPFRVVQVNHQKAEIQVIQAKRGISTLALIQTKVFPQFATPPLYHRGDERNFVIETKLQVSERVLGFNEQIGRSQIEHRYGVGSSFSQRPLTRFIETTGVCFYFADEELQREALAPYIALAFCTLCGIQQRDIGHGGFYSPISPCGEEGGCRGFAIFDTTYGSLRLTRHLIEKMDIILDEAQRLAVDAGATRIAQAIEKLAATVMAMPIALDEPQSDVFSMFQGEEEGDWISVIAPDQSAILYDGSAHQGDEVKVLRYLYTPQGLRYELLCPKRDVKWIVSASIVRAINGVTRMLGYNLMSGEVSAVGTAAPH
ncbi:MAG: DEAD/DEAH box helicase [Methylococcaceae bacterium]|nr:DEAD/DEAH box helicase [Methylococcaceae bacterium]